MPLQQFDERLVFYAAYQFSSASTPGAWVHLIGDTNQDIRLDAIQIVSNDTVDHLIEFDFVNADGTGTSGQVKVPAGSGYGGVAPVDALAALLPATSHYVCQTNTPYYGISIAEAVNAGKTVTVTEWGGAF